MCCLKLVDYREEYGVMAICKSNPRCAFGPSAPALSRDGFVTKQAIALIVDLRTLRFTRRISLLGR